MSIKRPPSASIGDGLQTTARWGGAIGLLTVLLTKGYILAPLFFGAIYFARSSLFSERSPEPAPVAVSTAVRSEQLSQAMGREIPNSIPQAIARAPSASPILPAISNTSLEVPQTVSVEMQHSPLVMHAPNEPSRIPITESPRPAGNLFGGLLEQPQPPAESTSTVEISSLFSSRRGRKFAGTAKQPGYPSQRVRLSIDRIQEQGSRISVQLSSLQGRRFTKRYLGYLEQKPDRLILTPDVQGIPMFITHAPWYVCQTRIELELSSDGTILEGTSVSGEEFRFATEIEASPAVARVGDTSLFSGFSRDGGTTTWQLVKHNDEQLSENRWEFHALHTGAGSYVWYQGNTVRASGSYAFDTSAGTIDLMLSHAGNARVYRGIIKSSDANSVQLCIARSSDASNRPTRVDPSLGNVFELKRR